MAIEPVNICSPVEYLPNLKRLSLRGTGLRNFSGRSYLGGLTYLGLDDNANLTFIDPLLGISLPNLVSLNLSDTPMLGNMPIGGYFTANECNSYVGIWLQSPTIDEYTLNSVQENHRHHMQHIGDIWNLIVESDALCTSHSRPS